jgi:hypothetical protein
MVYYSLHPESSATYRRLLRQQYLRIHYADADLLLLLLQRHLVVIQRWGSRQQRRSVGYRNLYNAESLVSRCTVRLHNIALTPGTSVFI